MIIYCKKCKGVPIEVYLDTQVAMEIDGKMTTVFQGFCHKCGQGYFTKLAPMIEITQSEA